MAKYTDEMVVVLSSFGDEYEGAEIPYVEVTAFIDTFNEQFETDFNQRSVGSKLRYMTYNLEKKTAKTEAKKYSEEDEATIREMCADPDNLPFMEAVAEAVGRDCKSIGGKLVSMNIFGVKKEHLAVKDTVKLFTPEDEDTLSTLCANIGSEDVFVEDLAEAVGKGIKQVRGKLAGMRIKGVQTRNKVAKAAKVYTDEVLETIQEMLDADNTLEVIAETLTLNVKGLHSVLAKKGMVEKSSKGKFWTDERTNELTDLVEAGKTRDEVAEAMNTTVAVIGKKAKALSIEFPKAA